LRKEIVFSLGGEREKESSGSSSSFLEGRGEKNLKMGYD